MACFINILMLLLIVASAAVAADCCFCWLPLLTAATVSWCCVLFLSPSAD